MTKRKQIVVNIVGDLNTQLATQLEHLFFINEIAKRIPDKYCNKIYVTMVRSVFMEFLTLYE